MAELLTTGLWLPEGPVLLPDGRIAFVEQRRGQVSSWDGERVGVIANGDGAWNAVTLGSDGHLYGAQNSGAINEWEAARRPTAPGLERITLDGTVEVVATTFGGEPALAPNDLAFGPDGRLYMTDTGHGYDPEVRGAPGKLLVAGPGGETSVLLHLDVCFCNGIGFAADGALLWVESYPRLVCRLDEDGRRQVLCELPEGHVPDGFAVAADGRIFIATVTSCGITVVSPDGEVLDHLRCGDDGLVTNCCFVGSDLVVTDFGAGFETEPDVGRLWLVPTDATGLPLHQGAL